jgi:hypothetical protein
MGMARSAGRHAAAATSADSKIITVSLSWTASATKTASMAMKSLGTNCYLIDITKFDYSSWSPLDGRIVT